MLSRFGNTWFGCNTVGQLAQKLLDNAYFLFRCHKWQKITAEAVQSAISADNDNTFMLLSLSFFQFQNYPQRDSVEPPHLEKSRQRWTAFPWKNSQSFQSAFTRHCCKSIQPFFSHCYLERSEEIVVVKTLGRRSDVVCSKRTISFECRVCRRILFDRIAIRIWPNAPHHTRGLRDNQVRQECEKYRKYREASEQDNGPLLVRQFPPLGRLGGVGPERDPNTRRLRAVGKKGDRLTEGADKQTSSVFSLSHCTDANAILRTRR